MVSLAIRKVAQSAAPSRNRSIQTYLSSTTSEHKHFQ